VQHFLIGWIGVLASVPDLEPLLPGPRMVVLQFYGKNSAKFEKILHYCHYVFPTCLK
jgi:hypothetical protein